MALMFTVTITMESMVFTVVTFMLELKIVCGAGVVAELLNTHTPSANGVGMKMQRLEQ